MKEIGEKVLLAWEEVFEDHGDEFHWWPAKEMPDLIAEIRRLRKVIKDRNHCCECRKLNPIDNLCDECWEEIHD